MVFLTRRAAPAIRHPEVRAHLRASNDVQPPALVSGRRPSRLAANAARTSGWRGYLIASPQRHGRACPGHLRL